MSGPRRTRYPSPPRQDYENEYYDSGDEYPSDEDLDEADFGILNSDYNAQRELTFHSNPQTQRYQSSPSIPPRLRKENEYHEPKKVPHRPPRHSSLLYEENVDNGDDEQLPNSKVRAYQYPRYPKRRPLIDLIKNEWQQSTSSYPSSPGHSTPNWVQVISAPRFRKYIYILFLLFAFTWGPWHYWGEPAWDEDKLLKESLKEKMRNREGWFGENIRPEFPDMVQVKTMDPDFIPSGGDRKRLIVIGDVHGCKDELIKLLSLLQYEARTDHLIFTGDMISKGPSSVEVIDLAMSAHASCVRGNNEDRVLLSYRDMYSHRLTLEQQDKKKEKHRKPLAPAPGMPEDMAQNDDERADGIVEAFEHGDKVDREMAKSFSKKQMDWLGACPVILDVGQIKGLGDVHVVHGGLVPGIRLERQDPMSVMHMRTIDLDTHVPSSSGEGTPWYKLWNKYQKLLPKQQRSTVIYGHDSHRGLQIRPYSKGLDTGCVKGGELSALVIGKSVESKKPRVVSVKCNDYSNDRKVEGDDKSPDEEKQGPKDENSEQETPEKKEENAVE